MTWIILEDLEAVAIIEAHLLTDLCSNLPHGPDIPRTFNAVDTDGKLVGGVSGSTSTAGF